VLKYIVSAVGKENGCSNKMEHPMPRQRLLNKTDSPRSALFFYAILEKVLGKLLLVCYTPVSVGSAPTCTFTTPPLAASLPVVDAAQVTDQNR
jgi:hypothetical protein